VRRGGEKAQNASVGVGRWVEERDLIDVSGEKVLEELQPRVRDEVGDEVRRGKAVVGIGENRRARRTVEIVQVASEKRAKRDEDCVGVGNEGAGGKRCEESEE